MKNRLLKIIEEHRTRSTTGIFSICSSHPAVLDAGARLVAASGAPFLVESTCNQVNQYGGYTGMTPGDFSTCVTRIAVQAGLREDQVLLGGDHLGPYPWRTESAAEAMQKARILVADCVRAGYTKLHLDTNTGCVDDGEIVPEAIAADRSAELCAVAEQTYRGLPPDRVVPCYVIGTEVPAPGGEAGGIKETSDLCVTTPQDAEKTLEVIRAAFVRRGLQDAWKRTVALVVQPGVEFSATRVREYERERARPLSQMIVRYPRLVYEAHSTDYQRPEALRRLVEDHFAILKVGPALTFAFREAVFALAWMEQEWLASRAGAVMSDLPAVLQRAMLADPRHWKGYYQGAPHELGFELRYSYSDRSRYYWTRPEVRTATAQLFSNLERDSPPLSLLSQFMPEQYAGVREGRLAALPREWVSDRITAVLRTYASACGLGVVQ